VGYRASVSLGVVGAVIVGVSLTPSLSGQAQTGAANRGLTKAQQEETRKLIHEVAEGLKAKQAASEQAGVPKNWKPARTPWGCRAGSGSASAPARASGGGAPLEDQMSSSASGPAIISSATTSMRPRIAASRRSQTSGLSLRYCLAFSRPWPMRIES